MSASYGPVVTITKTLKNNHRPVLPLLMALLPLLLSECAIVVADSGAGGGDDSDMDKGGGTGADPMDEDPVNPKTVFCIRLKQPRSNLQYKMSVPEMCRNFR
ncbi:hypothetical protein L1987_07071 [Smallanthus sonchifolius]|uniref:Uncharacterized protein n=1 Tax=Smallanthus sonchifolius TaxID=185202 RepID=A0ACB9K024_9ASTR|nr:hypothetical protein L1987_07071 [Smallanthus sonchifolius]